MKINLWITAVVLAGLLSGRASGGEPVPDGAVQQQALMAAMKELYGWLAIAGSASWARCCWGQPVSSGPKRPMALKEHFFFCAARHSKKNTIFAP